MQKSIAVHLRQAALNRRHLDRLRKASDDSHPIFSGIPHVIMSLENPYYKSSMDPRVAHSQLSSLGSKIEHIKGSYGSPENSLIIHHPKDLDAIKAVAKNMGQESLIYSRHGQHEMHFLNGDAEGTVQTGSGHLLFNKEPHDNYSTVLHHGQPIHFAYNFGNDTPHMLDLVHFSNQKGLNSIDPEFQGSARAGRELENQKTSRLILGAAGVNVPGHNYTHAYGMNSGVPESIFGGSVKYHIKVPKHKIYDLSSDPEGILDDVRKQYHTLYAPNESAMAHPDLVHHEIKKRGYQGFSVSGHPDPLFANTVMLYNKIPVRKKHKDSVASAVIAPDQSLSTKV
jgi:hypothetical protein